MKYRIISDTHFGHQFLIDLGDRNIGFEDKIHKQLVKIPKEDTLIHLGDICIGNDAIHHATYIAPLKCKKMLIRGNHDRKSDEWYLTYGWDFVCDSMTITKFGEKILFTHIPQPRDGYLNIHGHLHKNKHHSPTEGRCWLYSCEFENYIPRGLQKIVQAVKMREQSLLSKQ